MATLRCHHPPIISFHHCPRVHNVVRDAEKWRYMAFPSSFYWRSLLCCLLVLFHGHHREIRHDESAQTRGLKFPASNLFFGVGVVDLANKRGHTSSWKKLLLQCCNFWGCLWKVDYKGFDVVDPVGACKDQFCRFSVPLLHPPLHFLLSAHRCTSFNRMCSQNDQPQRLKLCSCNYKQMGGFICT